MRLRKNLLFSTTNIKSSIFALAVFLLSACHYEDREFDQIPINAPAEVKVIFREFYDYAHHYKADIKWRQLTVKYVNSSSITSGTSYTRNSIIKDYILINTASEPYKKGLKALLFHELGHYYLDRDHVDDWDSSWPYYKSPITQKWTPFYLPPTIMTQGYIIPNEVSDSFLWPYYVGELFGNVHREKCKNEVCRYLETVGP